MIRVGVLIASLDGDGKSVVAFKKGVGQVIRSVTLSDDRLYFEFENGYRMVVRDDGQSCCEHRYMHTDDDLTKFTGAVLLNAVVRAAPDVEYDYGVHEVQFFVVVTDKGQFTLSTHNEHNGYYGGFWIVCEEVAE